MEQSTPDRAEYSVYKKLQEKAEQGKLTSDDKEFLRHKSELNRENSVKEAKARAEDNITDLGEAQAQGLVEGMTKGLEILDLVEKSKVYFAAIVYWEVEVQDILNHIIQLVARCECQTKGLGEPIKGVYIGGIPSEEQEEEKFPKTTEVLEKQKVKWLMPAVRNKAIKKLMKEYDAPTVLDYTMGRKNFDQVKFKLVIVNDQDDVKRVFAINFRVTKENAEILLAEIRGLT